MTRLTETQRDAALPWCQTHNCCLRLAMQLVNGQSATEATGCSGVCPVTGQNGSERNQPAIAELTGLLGLAQ